MFEPSRKAVCFIYLLIFCQFMQYFRGKTLSAECAECRKTLWSNLETLSSLPFMTQCKKNCFTAFFRWKSFNVKLSILCFISNTVRLENIWQDRTGFVFRWTRLKEAPAEEIQRKEAEEKARLLRVFWRREERFSRLHGDGHISCISTVKMSPSTPGSHERMKWWDCIKWEKRVLGGRRGIKCADCNLITGWKTYSGLSYILL